MNDSDNIHPFPIFNLSNIPEALRKVANDLDKNPEYCEQLVLCGKNATGVWYKAFGPNMTKVDAVGIVELAKFNIVGKPYDS